MAYEGFKHTRLTAKLRRIAKEYNIKLRFIDCTSFHGDYCPFTGLIRVGLDYPSAEVISTFFHELAHFLEHKDGKFPVFYSTTEPLSKQRLVALRAERSADERGKNLCKEYFPNVKYDKAYVTKEDLEYHRNYYRDRRKE